MTRHRLTRYRAALSALLVVQAIAVPALAEDAKTHLTAADSAAAKKDWTVALAEYAAANKADPSAPAAEGAANAAYALKQDAEAYALYAAFLKDWGAKVAPYKKTLAETRMKDIASRTGELAIAVSEPGATITVDDKPATSPARLPAGPHRVRVTKEGFLPFDQAPNVAAGATATVDAKLQPLPAKSRLVVREKTGQTIRVVVDGVDQGDAPWSGDVDPGAHEVAGRSTTLSAPPVRLVAERGKTHEVELAAASSTVPLKISTNDGKGVIAVDDKVVGEGTFSGDVASGPHKIRITREGYDAFEESVLLKEKEPYVRTITLALSGHIETGSVQRDARRLEGIYGGVGLLGTAQPGGMKASMQRLCSSGDRPAELASCDEGGGLGAGLAGFVGYHWDPVGVELFVGAQYDSASPKLEWSAASTDPGLGPDPARTEEFTIRRAGGLGALRVRLTLQGEKLRFSFAGGAGIAYRAMFLDRKTTETSDPSITSRVVPSSQSYVAPALSLEPSLSYRLTPSFAIALGLEVLFESPNTFKNIPETPQDGTQHLGAVGQSTPAYELARNGQVFIGPFLGVMFGP